MSSLFSGLPHLRQIIDVFLVGADARAGALAPALLGRLLGLLRPRSWRTEDLDLGLDLPPLFFHVLAAARSASLYDIPFDLPLA